MTKERDETIISTLMEQRNVALNQVAEANGNLRQLTVRVMELESELAELKLAEENKEIEEAEAE